MIFLALMGVWVALWQLDLDYYFQLLKGTVSQLVELEKCSATTVQLSTQLVTLVHEGNVAPMCFYVIVFSILMIGALFSVFAWRRAPRPAEAQLTEAPK